MLGNYSRGRWTNVLLAVALILSIGLVGLTGCTEKVTEPEEVVQPTPEISGSNENSTVPTGQTQPVYYGEWVINKVQAFGIGTFSGEEAESLLGKSLSFTQDKASYFGDQLSDIEKVADKPIYKEAVISESDFITKYRMSFDNLGINVDAVMEVNVSDAKGPVSTYLVKDDNTLIIVGGGTYFEMVRKDAYNPAGDSTANSKIEMMAFIKAIDTEKKTILVDEIEWIMETDEKRIAELGLNSEDFPSGFYLYNKDESLKTISYDDALSIELLKLEEVELSPVSLKEFEVKLKERPILCNFSLENNAVVKISEQYLP